MIIDSIIRFIYLASRKIRRSISSIYSYSYTYCQFKAFKVTFKNFHTNGVAIVDLHDGGSMRIGKDFSMNNGFGFNRIGRQQPCIFVANNNGKILIGENVGISSTALHCNLEIIIGNNVRIGGNTVIYDTDFHTLDPELRISGREKIIDVKKKPVRIEDNVFIGAHSTILKGVTIGKNSIVGAGSVVTRSIPTNQIWGGNPAQLLRNLR